MDICLSIFLRHIGNRCEMLMSFPTDLVHFLFQAPQLPRAGAATRT